MVPDVTPEAATIEASITEGQRRYQELLDRRGQTRLLVTLWKQPSTKFRSLSVLDDALPPPSRPFWLAFLSALVAAIALGLVSLAAMPATLHAWERYGAAIEAAAARTWARLLGERMPWAG